jgi:RHS repeat-associated protein
MNQTTIDANEGRKNKKEFRPPESHRAPTISLPKGGSALKPIDEKFSVNPVNGTASLSLPLPFSHTRAGGPVLALQYDSGGGNGPVGLGWSFSLQSIQRRTDKQLPRYRDDEDGDTFLLSGAEDLVPAFVHNSGGGWDADETTVGNVHVKRYRPRTEGLFARIEKITVTGQAGFYWKVTTRDNVATYYGLTDGGRLTAADGTGRIFRWLPQLTFDDKGNCFEYIYKPEDLAKVPDSVEEQNRRNALSPFANLYLKRIRYGNRTPYHADAGHPWQPAAPATDYFFETVLDYGDHDDVPTPAETKTWPCRLDPFSDHRAGFEIRTWRLCRRILFFHSFQELTTAPGPIVPCLVRSLDLAYQHMTFADVPYQRYEADLLVSVQSSFYKRNGAGYVSKSYPPTALDYHPLAWNKAVQSVAPEDVVNAPTGGAGAGYQFVDLYGEGVSGILTEQANAWYYKSNLGGGHFSRAASVVPKPSYFGVASGALQIQDLAADGTKQVVVNAPGAAGYFEFAADGTWQPFRLFRQIPSVPSNDPNARLIDLNGDGKADLLVCEDVVLRWFPSLGRDGYDAAEERTKPLDEERGPALLFADGTQTIFLADMDGDGLTDIVRVRNADVCYWPNLGYGRFGAKVTMRGAPLFDAPDHFDPSAIRLFDVSGTGAADLVYLGCGGFKAWINLGGNAWSEPQPIDPFPGTEKPNNVSVLDLLGNGTGCVVWSSELPAHTTSPLRYVDLMGGRKPYLLSGWRNNLGAETRLEYESSSYYYLQDKNTGRPWVTRLPFPTMCVSRQEHRDTVSGVRFAHEYRYRHGYYDHAEREFRGFGMVETIDTEDFARFAASGASNLVDASVHQAPVRTRSWYHTGAFLDGPDLLHQFAGDYFHNAAVPEHTLPDPPIDDWPASGLTPEERRQAARSCKGTLLRQEVYADDGTPQEILPFSTAEHSCRLRVIQPMLGNRYAVFLTHGSESVTHHYERNPADPRIEHMLNTAIDELGNVLESASVTYGRITADASLPAEVQTEQARTSVLYAVHRYTKDVISDSAHRLRLPSESMAYELTGKMPTTGFFTLSEVASAFGSAADLDYELAPHAMVIERRLLEHHRTLYAADADPNTALTLETHDSRGLVHEQLALAFTPGLLSALFGTRVTPVMLAEGHYVTAATRKGAGLFPAGDADDHQWVSSGTLTYPANPDQHFYLPERYLDPSGTTTTVRYYADYHLMVDRTEDALGNRLTVEAFDFRFVQPQRTRDLNDNLAEVVFDIFGLVAGTAVRGKGAEADDLAGFTADLSDVQVAAFLADPVASGPALLQNASSRFVYSFLAVPPVAASVTRETHHQEELASGIPSKLQYALEYSDGGGRVVMKKLQAEPGRAKHCAVNPDGSYLITEIDTTPNRRWLGSGRAILNNKGKPVLQYEPYFSTTPAYEAAAELVETGVTPVLFYDAVGRLVRTNFPDGSFSHLEFDNWKKAIFDQNDTVLASDWYALRVGGGLGPAEQGAAQKTALHDGTPSMVHFDAHGRAHYAVAHNRFVDRLTSAIVNEFYATRTEFDIEGQTRIIHDSRSNDVMRYGYDLMGHDALSVSMDSGEHRSLNDALGKLLYGWDAKGNQFHAVYDILHRPIRHEVLPAAAPLRITGRVEYGTDPALNQNGQMLRRHDPSGIVSYDAYDFDGNLRQSTRRIVASASDEIDWTTPAAVALDARAFVSTSRYDALKRLVEAVAPDGSRTVNHYNESNLLSSVEVGLQGGALVSYIGRIDHDAKGQRLRIDYGNGVSTQYTYDELTYLVRNIVTTRASDGLKLQDLRYAYDPVANVVAIADAAQQTAYFNNAVVSPNGSYTYDAAYRLVAATGREQIGGDAPPDPWDDPRTHLPHKADGSALQNYLQQYEYDSAGNMTTMVHSAGAGPFANRWTRTFTPSATNNRLASSSVGAVVDTFFYDVHGNLTSMPHLSTIDWDVDNHLRSANIGAGSTAFYNYDTDGHRLRKVVQRPGGVAEERLYLGVLEIFRRTVNGVVVLERQSFHVLDRDRRLAIVDTRTAGVDNALPQLIRYQFSNHLGSASLEVDDEGAIIGYEEYYPFGSSSFQSVDSAREVPAKRYRYTGKERDEETGLYNHGARYYVPWLARWTAADPAGIKDGNNRYLYAGNRPIGSSDPTGMFEWTARNIAIIAAVVVVGVGVTVLTAGVGTAALGAAIGAAGLTGGAATAATVVGAVAVGAVAGGTGSVLATATGQKLTGTYDDPGALQARRDAFTSGAIAGGLTAGVGAALGAVARGGVTGVRAAQTATQTARVVTQTTRTARAVQGAGLGLLGGVTQEGSRQVVSGERARQGGFDWERIAVSGGAGAALGGATNAVAGPALERAGSALFGGGYRAGLGVGSPEARAAFFAPIARATGQNFVVSAPGTVAGRPVLTLATPRGPEAWYISSGGGTHGKAGAQAGDWVPFRGFTPESRLIYENPQTGARGVMGGEDPGAFIKDPSTIGLDENTSEFFKWGTAENKATADSLAKSLVRQPVNQQDVPWQTVQPQLEAVGVQRPPSVGKYNGAL